MKDAMIVEYIITRIRYLVIGSNGAKDSERAFVYEMTCNGCKTNQTCEHAWDIYNIHDECLLMK
jgi:hypothetical protein